MDTAKPDSADYPTAQVYASLRDMVFSSVPQSAAPGAETIWGVVMESGYPNGAFTLVALRDGTVSVYFSSGGGIIGLGPREGPRRAADILLSAAPAYVSSFEKTPEHPLPRSGHTCFYLITYDSTLRADVPSSDLENIHHRLFPLYLKCQDLITEARLIDEKARKK